MPKKAKKQALEVAMGAIEEMLQGKTPAERNEIKVREFAKLTGETFRRGAFELTIAEGPRATIVKGVPTLELWVELRRNGNLLPIDGHLRFVNPPIKVPDGTFRTETNPVTGETIRRANSVENPRQALRQIILETLRLQVAQL